MQIELVYEKTCPNIKAARTQLLRAFNEVGMSPRWQEWEVSDPDAPSHIHGYGSPTILVNGLDISEDSAEKDDYCCRVYLDEKSNYEGVPALEVITHALKSAHKILPQANGYVFGWQLNGPVLPAVGVAFLPKLVCPACWPAYAGLLSSLGIGFIDYTPYLLPLTTVFLGVALAALSYRAKYRRGLKPFFLGMVASAVLVVGKFYYDSDITMYVGLALLVLASLWNTWPKSQLANETCPACVTSAITE